MTLVIIALTVLAWAFVVCVVVAFVHGAEIARRWEK